MESKEKVSKKKKFILNKKSLIFIIVLAALLISSAVFTIIYFINKPNYEKYYAYEEKMNIYGFSSMYDNQTCKTEEDVTKSEAIKMILSTMLNTTDITKMSIQTDETYSNAQYVEYAVLSEIIEEFDITAENADENVTYAEVLNYIANAKKIILNEDPTSDVEVLAKNYKRINSDMQIIYADLVSNNIIPNEKTKIKLNSDVFKGQLNEMLINIAEEFNTITVGEDRLNINPDKIPANADQYTYILSNVDKKIYEYDFFVVNESSFENPRTSYLKKRDVYETISNRVREYYNFILNINYENINFDEFYDELSSYLVQKPNEEKIRKYVEYVKNNQIKLSGEAKVQMPIVYFDGEKYRARTKISFEILNSNTKNNLLVFDTYSNKNYEYTQDKYELVVDTKMLTAYKFNSLYIYPGEFISSIVNENVQINGK